MRVLVVVVSILLLFSFVSARDYRTYDGTFNNLDSVMMNAYGENYQRIDVNATGYPGDGSVMARSDGPSAREISNSLFTFDSQITKMTINDIHIAVGQLLISDIINTRGSRNESAAIPIPLCDPWKDPNCVGNKTLPFYRHAYAIINGTRQPYNDATGWIDLSPIYGFDNVTANASRAWTGGLLAPPTYVNPSPPLVYSPPQQPIPQRGGIIDPSKAPGGYLIQELFASEHNRLANQFAQANPTWSDEILFQEARRWNIAFWQKIILRHYIPILCATPLDEYKGYDPSVNAGIDVFFSNVAMIYGHAALRSTIQRLQAGYTESKAGSTLLRDAFYRPLTIDRIGWDQYYRGMFVSQPMEVGLPMVSDIRNFMFTGNGTDLSARNIQRGRDLGIPDYNTCRRSLGLPPITNFPNLTAYSEGEAVDVVNLMNLYPDINSIDPFVGTLSETPLTSAELGETMRASVFAQFSRLRDGDRFWFERPNYIDGFNSTEIAQIYNTTLGDIIARNVPNLDPAEIPDDVFYTSPVQFSTYAPPASSINVSWPLPGYLANSMSLSSVYKLSWELNQKDDTITWMIQSRSNGWIGIGWSADDGTMKNADIVLCSKTMGVRDSYALDVGVPTLDIDLPGGRNSVTNVFFMRNDSITTCIFTKPRTPSGDPWDKPIGPGFVKTIFAFNPTTDELVYHGPTRSASMYIDYLGVGIPPEPNSDDTGKIVGIVLGASLGGVVVGFCCLIILGAVAVLIMLKRKKQLPDEDRLLAERQPIYEGEDDEMSMLANDKGIQALEEADSIEVDPKQLDFGMKEVDKAPVNKVLRDKLVLTNWSSEKKYFKFTVPEEEHKYKIELWPGHGTIREKKSAEVSIELTLFMTTTVTRSIKLEVTSTPFNKGRSNSTTPLMTGTDVRVYYLPLHLTGEISTRLDPDEITIDQTSPIGSGSFGIVHRGTYRNQSVAVKLLRKQMDKYMIAEFDKEVVLMENLRSAYIVSFVGATHVPGKRSLVTEFCKLGSLEDLIFRDEKNLANSTKRKNTITDTASSSTATGGLMTSRAVVSSKNKGEGGNTVTGHGDRLNETKRLKIALNMAQAIHFLHSNKVMHRDIKPENFLVISHSSVAPQMVRLADFGTSRSFAAPRRGQSLPALETNNSVNDLVTSDSSSSSNDGLTARSEHGAFSHTVGVGTPVFMAPELLESRSYNMKVDVYSYGVVLWILWMGERPYMNFDKPWDIPRFVKKGNRLDMDERRIKDERVRELISSCWSQEPENRPDMSEVVNIVEEMLEQRLEERNEGKTMIQHSPRGVKGKGRVLIEDQGGEEDEETDTADESSDK
eukprot:TRINITY_DN25716_c0_g1_i1.p2 TRINITY_DN25716_c0_g1~~TRINITY_DN25716_c0_g1_i1.p2  ORF type:complete len:1320 (-),score=285.30 TRINITY_DN25716_c0_g1_i1:4094-8053(-)